MGVRDSRTMKTVSSWNWIHREHHRWPVTFSKLAIHRFVSICIVVQATLKPTHLQNLNSDPWQECEPLLNQLCQPGNRAYDRLEQHNTYGNEIKPWPYRLVSSRKRRSHKLNLFRASRWVAKRTLHDSSLTHAGRKKKEKNQDIQWLIIG